MRSRVEIFLGDDWAVGIYVTFFYAHSCLWCDSPDPSDTRVWNGTIMWVNRHTTQNMAVETRIYTPIPNWVASRRTIIWAEPNKGT